MVNTHQFKPVGHKALVASCLALTVLGGCATRRHIYDSYALLNSRKIAVLPGVGAPGPDGRQWNSLARPEHRPC